MIRRKAVTRNWVWRRATARARRRPREDVSAWRLKAVFLSRGDQAFMSDQRRAMRPKIQSPIAEMMPTAAKGIHTKYWGV